MGSFDYLVTFVAKIGSLLGFDVACRLIRWLAATAQDCSAYFALLYTAERFISVRYPLKRAVICTRRSLHIAIACVVVFTVALEVFNTIVNGAEMKGCYRLNNYRSANQYLQLFLHIVIGMFVPYLTIAILNTLIVYQMLHYRRQRAALSTGTNSSSDDAAQRAMIIMLVAVSSYSIIINIPRTISWVISPWRLSSSIPLNEFNILAEQILAPFTYCGNFFCVVSGKQFRQEILLMIRCEKQSGISIIFICRMAFSSTSPSSVLFY